MKLLNTYLIVAITFKELKFTTNIILYEFEGGNWIASVWPYGDGKSVANNVNIDELSARRLIEEQRRKKVIPLIGTKMINGKVN